MRLPVAQCTGKRDWNKTMSEVTGSYLRSSKDVTFEEDANGKGGTLTAMCAQTDGTYVQSTLRYDTSNQNGVLTSIPSGSYVKTSRNIQVENRDDGAYLTAECQRRDGSWTDAAIKIDLVNVDGTLVYNGVA